MSIRLDDVTHTLRTMRMARRLVPDEVITGLRAMPSHAVPLPHPPTMHWTTMLTLSIAAIGAAVVIVSTLPDGDSDPVVRVRSADAPLAEPAREHEIRIESKAPTIPATERPVRSTSAAIPLATPALLEQLGAVVDRDRCTIPIGTPMLLNEKRRRALERMGVEVQGDVVTARITYVVDGSGITNNGQRPDFVPITDLGAAIVCVSTVSDAITKPMSRRWPMILLDEYVGVIGRGVEPVTSGLSATVTSAPQRLYDVLLPVRVDVPELDDAHDPVLWFLPNTTTRELLSRSGIMATSIRDQGAGEHAAAIDVTPNPTVGTCSLVLRGMPLGNVNVALSSVDGKVVREMQQAIDGDEVYMDLDVSELASGVYVVSVTSNGQRITTARLMRR